MSADMGQFDARKTTPSSKEAQDQVFAKFKQRRIGEMSKIEEVLIEYLGERCPDFEPECVVCQGWLEWDQLKGNTNTEETGKWIILNYFPHEPAHVYGFFDTEKEAIEYAVKHRMDMYGNAFDVQMVLNAHYQERREPWE